MPHDATEIPPRHDLLIEVFSPDGRRINLLPCNDNVLDGLLADSEPPGARSPGGTIVSDAYRSLRISFRSAC